LPPVLSDVEGGGGEFEEWFPWENRSWFDRSTCLRLTMNGFVSMAARKFHTVSKIPRFEKNVSNKVNQQTQL
jgi:hypothetical protein